MIRQSSASIIKLSQFNHNIKIELKFSAYNKAINTILMILLVSILEKTGNSGITRLIIIDSDTSQSITLSNLCISRTRNIKMYSIHVLPASKHDNINISAQIQTTYVKKHSTNKPAESRIYKFVNK